MKIERLNDRQIRCTLTREDLASREIKLSELTYGTTKTRQLFQDMMEQASYEVGFDAEDLPLMIEAVPLNADCIVFIITKVEDPEELDTRFSKFAPSVHEQNAGDYGEDAELTEVREELKADEMLGLFRRLQAEKLSVPSAPQRTGANAPAGQTSLPLPPSVNLSRVFAFSSMELLLRLSALVGSRFGGSSALYKDKSAARYLLRITKETMSIEDFNRYCNMVSEYGRPLAQTPATDAFLEEHCPVLIPEEALLHLSEIAG